MDEVLLSFFFIDGPFGETSDEGQLGGGGGHPRRLPLSSADVTLEACAHTVMFQLDYYPRYSPGACLILAAGMHLVLAPRPTPVSSTSNHMHVQFIHDCTIDVCCCSCFLTTRQRGGAIVVRCHVAVWLSSTPAALLSIFIGVCRWQHRGLGGP